MISIKIANRHLKQIMQTEASRHYTKIRSSKAESTKYSLRTRSRVTAHTESSTTCMTVSSNGKISLKNISTRTVHSTKGTKTYNLNLKYEDIACRYKPGNKLIFQKFFCSQAAKSSELGCQCEFKCMWMDKWMNKWMTKISPVLSPNLLPPYDSNILKSSVVCQIDKDLRRTQPQSLTFQNQTYLSRLKDTLMVYQLSDPQVGYMQGMNIIASVPVYHSKSTYEAIIAFEMIMKKCKLREIYLNDLLSARKHSSKIVSFLKAKSNELYIFLVETHEVEIEIFIIGWLFSLLGSFVPLEKLHLIIDAFIEKGWMAIYSIIFTLLVFLKPEMMQAEEQTEIMTIISVQSLCEAKIDWEEIVRSSFNVPISQNDVY